MDTSGKPHQFLLVSMSPANDAGESMVRFVLDSEIFSQLIKVAPPKNGGAGGAVMAILRTSIRSARQATATSG